MELELFECRKLRCRLRPEKCLERHRAKVKAHQGEIDRFPECAECEDVAMAEKMIAERSKPKQEPERLYHCELHGQHSGWTLGDRKTSKCPKCVEESRLKNLGVTNKWEYRLKYSGGYEWIGKWIQDEAARRQKSPNDFIRHCVISAIPPEELKRLMLEATG